MQVKGSEEKKEAKLCSSLCFVLVFFGQWSFGGKLRREKWEKRRKKLVVCMAMITLESGVGVDMEMSNGL